MNDSAAIASLQRSVESLTEKVETMATDLTAVKVNIALMTGKFQGGWRVIVVIGGAFAVVVGWLISLHILKGSP